MLNASDDKGRHLLRLNTNSGRNNFQKIDLPNKRPPVLSLPKKTTQQQQPQSVPQRISQSSNNNDRHESSRSDRNIGNSNQLPGRFWIFRWKHACEIQHVLFGTTNNQEETQREPVSKQTITEMQTSTNKYKQVQTSTNKCT